jgi:hypothetical protein
VRPSAQSPVFVQPYRSLLEQEFRISDDVEKGPAARRETCERHFLLGGKKARSLIREEDDLNSEGIVVTKSEQEGWLPLSGFRLPANQRREPIHCLWLRRIAYGNHASTLAAGPGKGEPGASSSAPAGNAITKTLVPAVVEAKRIPNPSVVSALAAIEKGDPATGVSTPLPGVMLYAETVPSVAFDT